ncbi:hypothetical protein H6770_00350 [Candidatus Peribacteria bacterium]|nr:hypothetical protein [Candidatus Peribacteria bacterium]
MALHLPRSQYYQEVAETIGGGISDDEVEDVIVAAEEQGILFHGLSRMEQYPTVMQTGIHPHQYENSTSWQEPSAIFGVMEHGELVTQGSVFFDMGHTYDPSHKTSTMMIALSTYARLIQVLEEFPQKLSDGFSISGSVPPSAIHFFRVSQSGLYADDSAAIPEGSLQSPSIPDVYIDPLRNIAKSTEEKMFRALQKIIMNDVRF